MANRRFELFDYRQVLASMRQGDSDRDIARGELMGRKKLTSVRREAQPRDGRCTVRQSQTDPPREA
ncbi:MULTISPECIES: hypothetical protein [Burkholderia]|uniref:hypothetical protein n=1 Tax=Burkholderia TaxID=32008 RepID=UPI000A512CBF|nr:MULTISPECIES: hypothetical protein [Burkholderia]